MKKNQLLFLFGLLFTFNHVAFSQTASTDGEPYYTVEKMPEYPGGNQALFGFIKEKLQYPEKALNAGIEGRIVLRFIVSKTGEVTDISVMKSLSKECDEEGIRILKLMPKWKPGQQEGKNVAVYFTLPIAFKIHKAEPSASPLLIVDGVQKPYSLLDDTLLFKKENIESMSILKEESATTMYGDKGKNGAVIIVTKIGKTDIDTLQKNDQPRYGVEVMPQFPGGEDGLMAFIRKNLKYPYDDAAVGIQGRTTIRFTIKKTGKIEDIRVIRSLSPGCDAEAVRIIRLMPDWIPGTQKGSPVDVYYTLPIVYKLQM